MIGLHSDSGAEMAFRQRSRIRSSTLSADTQRRMAYGEMAVYTSLFVFLWGSGRCGKILTPYQGKVGALGDPTLSNSPWHGVALQTPTRSKVPGPYRLIRKPSPTPDRVGAGRLVNR